MIVVPVLITNCHVSLKPKIGPVITHTAIMATAMVNTRGRPQKCAAAFANLEYQDVLGITRPPRHLTPELSRTAKRFRLGRIVRARPHQTERPALEWSMPPRYGLVSATGYCDMHARRPNPRQAPWPRTGRE